MNAALAALARKLQLAQDERLRVAFAAACIDRVRHLLEQPRALALAEALAQAAREGRGFADLQHFAQEAAEVARSHPGSRSLDGGGHSAVSATHALAKALAGRELEAADYAAYAAVYAYGGYAVADLQSFEPEHAWQVDCLRRLHGQTHAAGA